MSKVLTEEQANRLREDVKRGAHVQTILKERAKQLGIKDPLFLAALLLAVEEYDAVCNDLDGMLLGNKQKEENADVEY